MKPSSWTNRIFNSIFRNTESEIIFANCMTILSRTGDEWRKLTWEEYKEERLKDGNFSEYEKSYFEKVLPYTLSNTLAQEVADGIDGYVKKYKHQLEKIYFYKRKYNDNGYFFKDLSVLDKIIQLKTEYFKKYKIEDSVESCYELIEVSLLKKQPDWIFKSYWGEEERESYNKDYFIELDKIYYYPSFEIKRFKAISLELLAFIQEKDCV